MTCVVSHYWPAMEIYEEFFALACVWNGRACEKMGWPFFFDTKRRVPERNPWREKSAKLIEVFTTLVDGDRVLWIDGDCLMVGNAIQEIFEDLGDSELGMVKYGNSKEWNCGVTPMVLTEGVRELWRDIRDHPNPELLDLEEHARALGPDCAVMAHGVRVKELGRRWNDKYDEVNKETQIIGFHGLDGYSKRDRMLHSMEVMKWRT